MKTLQQLIIFVILFYQTNINITNIVTKITRENVLVSLPLAGGGFTGRRIFVGEGVGITVGAATGTKTAASYINEYSYKQ